MANNFIRKIRQFIEGNSSVRKVADDPSLTSELILLVRMMLADGELKPAELANFRRICQTAFAIPEEDVGEVIQYLKDFGYDTSAADAAAMFGEFEEERKRALLVHMLSIAKSDDELDANEAELIRRTASVLGLTPADIEAARSEMRG
jgi:uncharacterized tellurite resistance protein B-like protein